MFTYRRYPKFALMLVLLLAWTQLLVAAHGVIHPFQDGGAQHHAPATDKPLCDLCVISALDHVPTALAVLDFDTDTTFALFAEPVSSQTQFTFTPYTSRAPPTLA
ncbi:MAG: hypothetical protein HOP20_00430 [Sulfuriferula sp.]|nr:hypothetical protein [Sulfuriferula sp.]